MNHEFWSKAARQALSLMRRRNRPVLAGEISLWTGMSLHETEGVLGDLVRRNLVRQATGLEVTEPGHLGNAFVLVDPQSIPMGEWDAIPASILGEPRR